MPFDLQPIVLQGNVVRIEPLTLDHAGDLHSAGLDPAIWPYMPIAYPDTPEKTRAWIESAIADQSSGQSIAFAIVHLDSGKAIGSTRYLDIQPENRALEIGWTWIGTAYQRTAVNTECKYLLIRNAFEEWDAVRVQLKTDGRNLQSQKAIARIGAKQEGILRKHRILWDGYIRDTVYFCIVKEEWPQAKERLRQMINSYPR